MRILQIWGSHQQFIAWTSCFLVLISGCVEKSNSEVVELPDHSGTLSLQIRPIHPFLAEYEYDVTVNLKATKSFTIPLQPQTGGQPCITIKWYGKREREGPLLSFDYKSASEQIQQCFDLTTRVNLSSTTDTFDFRKKMQTFQNDPPIKLFEVK